MGKYLITGRPGSGKTTLIEEISRRGYQAFNTDDLPNVTQLEEQDTGKIVPWPDGPVDWGTYIWNWQEEGLKDLLETDGDVFIGTIVGNQQQYYHLFDRIFALIVSPQTLERRLDSHTHERTSAEKARAIANLDKKQEEFTEQGLILISGDRTVNEIADEVLAILK